MQWALQHLFTKEKKVHHQNTLKNHGMALNLEAASEVLNAHLSSSNHLPENRLRQPSLLTPPTR